ncbi:heparan-alpha-glucosaminide N-acetyltransferase [Inquilinus sp. Marseille-Q2685]|uniref:heparan-alpha-glucosaminide N-acetyltransferase n=1 Tax=Inquilinus sp. Marseille-Q2685 TaxID=2866581 RepID=UPI001CE3BB12|nr:heparan-alpha-glucosaminide N-acetyltransferase [Inquilinus sp. Marseille-Q2685]
MTPSARPGRLPVIDLLRGLALLAMALYHLSWDLTFFRFVDWDLQGDAGWIAARYLIAGSFLALVGVGLVLWDVQGRDWRRWAIRLAKVVAGAAAVTAATRVAIPDQFIFFGILHCIAVASILGLLFLRLPPTANFVLGLAVIALPILWRSALLDHPWLLWTGLGTQPPRSNDYEPLFPWFGPVLLGIALARWWLRARAPGGTVDGDIPGRPLRWAGRHSLAVYLVHQPLLIGLLLLVGMALGRDPWEMLSPAPDPAPLLIDCQVQCEQQGGGTETCHAYCGCMVDGVRAQSLWPALRPDAAPELKDRLRDLAAVCSR